MAFFRRSETKDLLVLNCRKCRTGCRTRKVKAMTCMTNTRKPHPRPPSHPLIARLRFLPAPDGLVFKCALISDGPAKAARSTATRLTASEGYRNRAAGGASPDWHVSCLPSRLRSFFWEIGVLTKGALPIRARQRRGGRPKPRALGPGPLVGPS